MANFALDIENQRIAEVMMELGIAKEELITKRLEDFSGPNTTLEIQKLRFDHYTTTLRNTVNDIRNLLKKRHASLKPSDSKVFGMISYEDPSYGFNKNLNPDGNKFPYKQKELLMNTLTNFDLIKSAKKDKKKTVKLAKSDINLTSIENKKNYKEMFKKCRNLQAANLQNLKKDQIQSQLNLYKKSIQSLKEHTDREKYNEDYKRKLIKDREDMYVKKKEDIDLKKYQNEHVLEGEIAERLQKFESKIHKSEEIRFEAIKEKVTKTLKLREASERVENRFEDMKKSNEIELFNKLIDKQNKVKTARERIEEENYRKILRSKEKFDKRHNQALEKIKSAENDLVYKSKKFENQLMASQKTVFERKQKLSEEFEMKKELKKLKDYDSMLKIQRAKRRFDYKMTKNLEKTLQKYKKVDEIKSAKEREATNSRDAAIKAMIEKEKLLEAVAVIIKSPRSKTAQEKLKTLNILSREPSFSDEKA